MMCRCGGTGRRPGLKIPWENIPYRFDSGQRHHFFVKTCRISEKLLLRQVFDIINNDVYFIGVVMKKKIIIGTELLLLIIIGIVVFSIFPKHELLSGSMKNVEKVIVIKDIYGVNEKKDIPNSEFESLLHELKSVQTTKIKHPRHLESMQNNPYYTIEITYSSGKVDTIYSTEIKVKFYRFLDTKGADGDDGYILSSKSDSILNILEKLIP